jgi:hypothetical protein
MRPGRIAGWRQRRDLGLLMLGGWAWGGVSPLVRALSESQLNLAFVLLHRAGGAVEGGLGLERGQSLRAAELARQMARERGWPAPVLKEPATALILYPLAGGLALLAEAVAVLAAKGLSPLALGTSPAALTLILADNDLPRAVEALRDSFELPPEPQPEVAGVVQSRLRREA